MKNWDTLEADITMLVPVHYTPGRTDRIRYVVVHHNGGNLSTQGCYNVWLTREASAHYQVEDDGTIGQLVNDWDTAWHAGDYDANSASIGIEHANSYGVDGPLTEATLDNGAHLVAALCKQYGLGRPQWKVNVFPHQYFYSTACPGHLAGSQRDAYMARAQQWYDSMTGAANVAPPTQEDEVTPQDKLDIAAAVWEKAIGGFSAADLLLWANKKAWEAVAQQDDLKKATAAALAEVAPQANVDVDALAAKIVVKLGEAAAK